MLLAQPRPQPIRAMRVNKGGLEPSAIARIFPTSLIGDVTSKLAEDDWERVLGSELR